jgi:hypothetical protein
MKYSADLGDRGEVTLNGKPLTDVIECDPDEGYAVVAVKRDGRFVIEGDEIKTERLTGAVTFTRAAEAA